MDTKTIIMIIMGAVIAVLSYFLVRSYTADIETTIETVTDTIYSHSTDTLYVFKENIHYEEVRVTDTIFLTDTILVREQKVYQDSLSKIWISGVDPEIDSLYHFVPRDTVLINTTTSVIQRKKQGWGQFVGVGMSGGYGVSISQAPQFSPFVGVTVTYGWGFHF